MPKDTLSLRRIKGDMSIPQREGEILSMEPSSPAPRSGVRRHGRSGCLLAGGLWVGSFQPVLVVVPFSVRYDLPLCSVAEHWWMRYFHSPLESLCGKVVKGRDSPAFPHWADGRLLPLGCQKENGKHLGRGRVMYPLLLPPTPLNLLCPLLVFV